MDVPDSFVNMTVEAYNWDSEKPITLNELDLKMHIKPTSVLFFWTNTVSYTSSSAKYISCSKYMVHIWRLNFKLSRSSETSTWPSSWRSFFEVCSDYLEVNCNGQLTRMNCMPKFIVSRAGDIMWVGGKLRFSRTTSHSSIGTQMLKRLRRN